MLKVLEADFARLPGLLGGDEPAEQQPPELTLVGAEPPVEQLGLF